MRNLESSQVEVLNPSEVEIVMESPKDFKVKSKQRKKTDVRKMAIIGVLSAISIMLSMTPLGFIPIGPTNATIMHIPVIIGAIIEGPVVGITVGFIFGATSLLKALTMPTITSFAFVNPLVSVLPRMLIGIVAYYVYKLTIKFTKNVFVSGWITGVMGSLVNTAVVLGMIYILYGARYAEALGESASAAKTLILTLVATNGIPEAIVGGFVVSAVCVVFNKRKK
ncbi:ECF transporter S component [Romboutsia ilealis]|uniref:ECF transporter S component n=1 Tax=Romboutsia ilealis TaxID=1115758 RepID=UPI002F404F2E